MRHSVPDVPDADVSVVYGSDVQAWLSDVCRVYPSVMVLHSDAGDVV